MLVTPASCLDLLQNEQAVSHVEVKLRHCNSWFVLRAETVMVHFVHTPAEVLQEAT